MNNLIMPFRIEDLRQVVIAPNLFSDTGEQNIFYYTKDGRSRRIGYANTDETQLVFNYLRDHDFVSRSGKSLLIVILEPNS